VYTFLIDDLRERILTDRIIAGTWRASGSDIELPDIDTERERFDAWLISTGDVNEMPIEQRELLQALGLRV
jgi:hypothetical protein